MNQSINEYNRHKRIVDILLSLILIPLFLPLLLILILVVYLDDYQNPFFCQARLGLHKKQFIMYKIRSMKANSELLGSGYYCYANDDRITRIGNFLRRTSLDELPQIYNIIRGDMSFVGPRPPVWNELECETISEQNKIKLEHRFLVRPGLTGLAQVSGRNELDWNTRIEYDWQYVEDLKKGVYVNDFKIWIKTIFAITRSKGQFDKTHKS